MQFTKKFTLKTKLISLLLTLMLAFTFMIPASAFTIKASAAASDWDSIEIENLKTEYDIYATVVLPTVTGATMKLIDPRGNDITSTVTGNQFNANIAGKYQLSYTNGKATTGIIYINVVAKQVAFKFDTNTDKLIPTKMPTDRKVVFPNPSIVDQNGEVISGEVADIKLIKADNTTEQTLVDEDGGFKSFTFSDEGKYELIYTYGGTQSSGSSKITKKYVIEVDEDYEATQKISFNLKSSMPTSAIQGVEVELPKVSGLDKDNATIDVYTTIKVEHIAAGNVRTEMPVTDFKFVPTKAGNYEITYKVVDALGNPIEKTYVINDVSDTKAPTIKVVENYAVANYGQDNESVADNILETLVEAQDKIPTRVATGTTVSIPAIFASDNVSEFKNLELTRRIKKDNAVIANLDDTDVAEYANNKKNEAVSYTFNEAGTYTIIYTATDGKNTTSDSLASYTIRVEDGFTDSIAPTVEVTNFITDEDGNVIYSVKPSQKIKVAVPTVTDKKNPSDPSNNDVSDLSPTLKVYMFASVGATSDIELTLNKEKTYYEGTVPADAEGILSIKYVAKDDNNNSSNEIKTIEIINTADAEAPTFTNSFDALAPIEAKQFEEVDLSTYAIVAQDAIDKNLDLSIVVRNPNGEIVDMYDYEKEIEVQVAGGSKATAKAKFVANMAGTYTINYVAKDSAGNMSIKAVQAVIASQATPMITLSNYETVQELGKVVIPKAFVYLDGEKQDDSWIKTKVIGDINKHGEVVTVEYVAENPSNNKKSEVVTATFTVKDTTKPTITFDSELDSFAQLVEVTGSNPKEYEPIVIPAWTASDNGTGIDLSKLKITAKDSKGNTVNLLNSANNKVTEIVGNSSECKFVPTKDGKYTIARFQADAGKYTLLSGEFKTTQGPLTFGTYMWAEFKDWPKVERKMIEGAYIHHMSEIEGDYKDVLKEFCKYIDDIEYDPIEE